MASFEQFYEGDDDLEDLETVTCKGCKTTVRVEDCDILGACEGNVFCANCNAEIEVSTGLPALLCGECDNCQCFIEDGSFHQLQDMRLEHRWDSMGYYN